MFKKKTETKSPLKARPLRLPGQSIDDELNEYFLDKLLFPYILATMFWLITGLEWWRHYKDVPPNPWFFTFVSMCITAYAAAVIIRRWKHLKQLKLGREGERAVGQFLDRLSVDGYRVFHDVVTGDANIDHVLVGPNGVFSVETKTLSKPSRGKAVITVRHDTVEANGRPLTRNPIPQAKAQAAWLRAFLSEAEFDSFVQPVVAFPGWYVNPFDHRAIGTWVLEPKAIPAFIGNLPQRLSAEQISAITSSLSSYVRANAAK